MEIYPLVVTAHVVLVIVAFMAHGVSAFSMFALRRETDRARMGALLDLSSHALAVAGYGLILAVLSGIIAAVMAGSFSRAWPWVSIVVVAIVWIAMTPLAGGPMNEIRKALGLHVRGDKPGDPPREPADDATLAATAARLRPEAAGTVGLVGLVVLVWLMEVKPF